MLHLDRLARAGQVVQLVLHDLHHLVLQLVLGEASLIASSISSMTSWCRAGGGTRVRIVSLSLSSSSLPCVFSSFSSSSSGGRTGFVSRLIGSSSAGRSDTWMSPLVGLRGEQADLRPGSADVGLHVGVVP